MPLDDSSHVIRAALYPKFVLQSGLFSPELLVSPFSPIEFDGGGSGYALSVGNGAALTTVEARHDFGCRVAAVANARREAAADAPLVRGLETFHYRGSYQIENSKIRQIHTDAFTIGIETAPEENLPEHCHIELRPHAGLSKSKQGKARTGIIAQLYRLLRHPQEHICACDEDLRSVLETHSLPEIEPV